MNRFAPLARSNESLVSENSAYSEKDELSHILGCSRIRHWVSLGGDSYGWENYLIQIACVFNRLNLPIFVKIMYFLR